MRLNAKRAFDVTTHLSDAVAAQAAYIPGEQPQDSGWVKLNTNENPYPPSPHVAAAIRRELGADAAVLRLYPSPSSSPLRAVAARFHGVHEENVLAGNGSDDVLNLLTRAFSDAKKPAGMLDPSYSLYPVLSGLTSSRMKRVPVSVNGDFDLNAVVHSGANIFFLTNPNAPLGLAFPQEKISTLLAHFDGVIVVDEAYAPFADDDMTGLLGLFPNLVITRTFSKAYALAGMRIGYALAHAHIIAALDKVRDSYNLDRLAQTAAIAALEDKAYYDSVIAAIKRTRDATASALRKRAWDVLPSQANFLMAAPSPPVTATAMFDFLKVNKVLIRHFPGNPLTAPFLRISIGTDNEMSRFLDIVDAFPAQTG